MAHSASPPLATSALSQTGTYLPRVVAAGAALEIAFSRRF